MSFQNSIDMFLETKFRNKANAQRGKRQSTVDSTSNLLKNDQLQSMARQIETRERKGALLESGGSQVGKVDEDKED